MPSSDNVESTLIWFRGTQRENYKYWAESLEEFLAGNYFFNFFSLGILIFYLIILQQRNMKIDV